MSFQFPNNPTIGQQVINPTSSAIYTWDGVTWEGDYLEEIQRILPKASFAVTASIANEISSNPIFSNTSLTEFNWFSPVNGNPTASGAILTGSSVANSATFVTTNNYDGVRVATSGQAAGGTITLSSSYIDFDSNDIWITWDTKIDRNNTNGLFLTLNRELNPVPAAGFTAVPIVVSSSLAIRLNDNSNTIQVYNSSSTNLRAEFTPIGGIQDNVYTQWDFIIWKQGANYLMNIYQSFTSAPNTEFGLNKKFPYPVPVNTTNNNIVPINLGTQLPKGGFKQIVGVTAFSTNTNMFTNKLQIRSATLAPFILGPYK